MMVEGKVQINLVFAKSRISPKKTLYISRLELKALLIGVRSLKFFSKELGIEDVKKIIWIYSQCILNWLKSKKLFFVFTKNRFAEIIKENNFEFHCINMKDNPADIPSRLTNSTELKDCLLWWNGLKWLKEDSTC